MWWVGSKTVSKISSEFCATCVESVDSWLSYWKYKVDVLRNKVYRVCQWKTTPQKNFNILSTVHKFEANSQTLHCVSKKFTHMPCYNFDNNKPVLTMFGRNVIEKVSSQKYSICPPYLTSASALPCKMHVFTQIMYYSIAGLQPVTGLIYSVLLRATHTLAAVLLCKSHCQWS